MASESLNSVIFIKLPEGFQFPTPNFVVDNEIPLPVQLTPEEKTNESFNPNDLTLEKILAGILTVLAYDTKNQHIEYYRHFIKAARPDIQKELTDVAILKTRNEDYELAEDIFAALRGYDPSDMVTILNSALFYDYRGTSFRESGFIEDADACDNIAENYYKTVMADEEPIPDGFFNAGYFYLKNNNFQKCKETLDAFLLLTNTFDEDELDDDARRKIEEAKGVLEDISLNKLDDNLFHSAYEALKNDDEEKALTDIKAFLEHNPKVWNAWFLLGWTLRRLERWEDGVEAFMQAISLGGNNSETYNELAICLLELGRYDECKERLYEALKINPENTKIISNLGLLALKQGDFQEAHKMFSTVLAFDENDEIALKALETLEQMN